MAKAQFGVFDKQAERELERLETEWVENTGKEELYKKFGTLLSE